MAMMISMTKKMMQSDTRVIELPPKLVELFNGEARYRVAYGGRGSGKSRSFAIMAAVRGYMWGQEGKKGQILCAREFMNSLRESSFTEIEGAIQQYDWLADYYEVGERLIRSKDGNIDFTFSGLRRSLDSIKSKSRILLCWIDEAENVSSQAYDKLIPTVREEGSEVWVSYNPESTQSATHKRFREQTPESCKIAEMNWRDNPYFPVVLERERREDLQKRPETYQHIWEGDFLTYREGAYYAVEMAEAREQDRITTVPYDKNTGVVTAWDLGIDDSTAIWFAQYVGKELRLIDYYEASGYALDHYAKVLSDKGYHYITHILPHDVKVKELGTGKSRFEVLQGLGLHHIEVCPMLSIEDGIQQVRSNIPMAWFDKEKCDRGINALMQYRRDWDEVGKAWRGRPLHDWSSHGADAMRYLAVGYRPMTQSWNEPIRRNIQGLA